MDNLTAGNPRAHRIRLYYTESSTIYEGMPVCYEFDATTNWFGGSVSNGEVTASTTTSEGSHNEGKYIRVEDVDADNIHAFAGIVTKGGWCGKTGPRALDVYVPNGAIVPVRCDQNCTVGKTILAIHTGETHLTAPFEASGRPVAVAWETVDTATTTGLCLAKLDPNMFIYQKGDAAALEVDDEDTGNIMPNQIWVGTRQASGLFSALQIKGYQLAGNAESWDYGLALNSNADFSGGTITSHACGNGLWLNLGEVTVSGSSIVHAARCGVYEGGDATFTSVGLLTCLGMTLNVATDPGANTLFYFNVRNDGAHAVDGLFQATDADAIGLVSNSDTVDYGIPFRVGGTTYYLAVTSSTS